MKWKGWGRAGGGGGGGGVVMWGWHDEAQAMEQSI